MSSVSVRCLEHKVRITEQDAKLGRRPILPMGASFQGASPSPETHSEFVHFLVPIPFFGFTQAIAAPSVELQEALP